MEGIIFIVALGLLVEAFILAGQGHRLRLVENRIGEQWRFILQVNKRIDDPPEDDSDDEEEDDEPVRAVFCPTHCITNHGREVFVRKSRPGYGVDMGGKQWPLFIKPGQSDYAIKRV